MRLCLLGLPRCGSQYISSLINLNAAASMKNLCEPFTPNHLPSLNDVGSTITHFDNYEDQVSEVINLMQAIDSDQSLILKLFLHSWLPIEQHRRIVQALTDMGFKFLIIKRKNITEQILSLGIGLKLNKFTNFGEYDNSIVDLDNKIISDMEVLKNDIANFDFVVKQLQLDQTPVIHYETVHKDLIMLLKKPISLNTRYKKMSVLPSFERISNIHEVIDTLGIK